MKTNKEDYMEKLFELRFVLLLLMAILLFAIFEWSAFKTKAYAVMLAIKQRSKEIVLSGHQQETLVVNKLFTYIPNWIHKAIPDDVLRKIIAYLYNRAMDYLDDGKANNSYNKNANTSEDRAAHRRE